MNDAAGSWSFYHCPGCNERIKIYSRSFAGNGKICPHCKGLITPAIWNEKEKRYVARQLKLHRNQRDA